MANAIYPFWKEDMMSGVASRDIVTADGGTNNPIAALVQTGYTYADTHHFASDLGANVAGSGGAVQALTGLGVTQLSPTFRSTFYAANPTFPSVAAGTNIGSIVIYRHTSGANTAWCLVVYLDTGVTGLPLTPNGGNITVSFAAGGIFFLSDGEVKEDIKPFGQLGAAMLYQYRYRGEEPLHVGMIAQEIEQFAPEAVREFDGRKHVNYALAAQEALRLAA